MNKENETQIKPLTPGELAQLYNVSRKTLNSWLAKHAERIGERASMYFTALQVKKIYDCIGPPLIIYKD